MPGRLHRNPQLAIKATLSGETDLATRYMLALQLRDFGLPNEAASLLEGRVDLQRPTPGATLYLECLAAARCDDAFRSQIAKAGSALRNDPGILWTTAAHAWNIGDLAGAEEATEQLLSQEPGNGLASLLRIEILVRQNRTSELLVKLDKPVEHLVLSRLKDRIRIASLLGHFGYVERAAKLAYRLFLENRDKSQAWMSLSSLVLEQGSREGTSASLWGAPVVGPDVAVDIRYDDGQELFVVVEPDPTLCRLDNDSWEITHPLIRTLIGKRVGDQFTDGGGRQGTVVRLRHKYVARLHFVLQNYETRFPEIMGVRSIPVDAEKPGGLDRFIAELKERSDWLEVEYESYSNGPWPIEVLAHRIGQDCIDAAAGLASHKRLLKVAIGNVPEREAATVAVRANGRKGCVLDLLSFWTAWRLNALSIIVATCGPISLPRSVVDRLLARREKIASGVTAGLRSAHYENGRLVVTERTPEVFQVALDDIDHAISWAEANTRVCPLIVTERIPLELREPLREGPSFTFDSLALAIQEQLILITDDQSTRELARALRFMASTWLHSVLSISFDRGENWARHLYSNDS
jgi:PIN domain associated with the TPR-GreAB-C-PIN system